MPSRAHLTAAAAAPGCARTFRRHQALSPPRAILAARGSVGTGCGPSSPACPWVGPWVASSLRGRRALAWRLPPWLQVQAEPGPCALGHFLIPEHTAQERTEGARSAVCRLPPGRSRAWTPFSTCLQGGHAPALRGPHSVPTPAGVSRIPSPRSSSEVVAEEGRPVLTWLRPTLSLWLARGLFSGLHCALKVLPGPRRSKPLCVL